MWFVPPPPSINNTLKSGLYRCLLQCKSLSEGGDSVVGVRHYAPSVYLPLCFLFASVLQLNLEVYIMPGENVAYATVSPRLRIPSYIITAVLSAVLLVQTRP